MNRSLWKRIRIAVIMLMLIIVATAVTECDELPETKATPAVRPVVQPGAGIVRGRVKFGAARPAPKVIGGDCCPGAAPVFDESTALNDDGTLRNVVVYVKDGPNVNSATSAPAVLDQKDCRYVPHVLALRTNEPLDVMSHDPTMHNIHVQASANRAENFSQTTVGANRRLTFASPEVIRFKCDVHPWMSAYVCVFDHPFFAVTGDGGTFQIEKLPPGNYTLAAWHERYGSLETQVNVSSAGQSVQAEFEYTGK